MRILSTGCGLILVGAAACAQDRFPQIPPDRMTADQKKVADAIVAGPRKTLTGPFNAWLRSPELADRLQKVGEYVRFNTTLPARLNEFAIMITARHWTAQYEWFAHYPLAIKAGLDAKILADLAAGRRPASMKEDESIVYDFSTQLHRDMKVSDSVYKAAVAKFGEQGIVDLIGVNGYYDVVSMTLSVAQVTVPPGQALPLKALEK
jgi:4-carboxymuconolactone decarboxylase